MNGNTPDQAELKNPYEVFAGKTILEAIRDTVAQACTGYNYEELKDEVTNPDNDGMLEIDEIEEIDRTVTILLHLFKYHCEQVIIAQQPSSHSADEAIQYANDHGYTGGDNALRRLIGPSSQAIERAKIEARIDECLYIGRRFIDGVSTPDRISELKSRLAEPNETGGKV